MSANPERDALRDLRRQCLRVAAMIDRCAEQDEADALMGQIIAMNRQGQEWIRRRWGLIERGDVSNGHNVLSGG